ncbi:MAG: glucokinase [Gammaproteobacteria bacterium]|nr:glucokinase [Gammaproteobacteria bacterium]
MILVADVGGTHTRLALAAPDAAGWQLHRLATFPTAADVPALVRRYLAAAGTPRPRGFACAGAGPIGADGRIRLTNSAAVLDPDALAAAAGLRRTLLINDFEAVAHALPALAPEQLRACGGGQPDPRAPRLALGAGTGLGIAALLPEGGDWRALPGEGGHADLAPVDDEELAAWQRLRAAHGRVTAETVLSGPGLERLYAALRPEAARLPAPEIVAAAGDPFAARAVRLFTRWLGRVAGNLVLSLGARGGVYLAGGIVPAWAERFDAAEFRRGFEDKAPFGEWMRGVPSYVVTHPQPGLLGLARYASRFE